MKGNFKKIILTSFIVVMLIIITGCGNNNNNDNNNNNNNTINNTKKGKSYAFPKADFIPSGMEYKGSGKIEYSSVNEELNPKHADAFVSNAKIEDVVDYVNDLKSKGLHNANQYAKEQDGFDEYGSYSWVGVNDENDFSISVTITDESTKLNLVDASYNLSIVMSDNNPYE